MSSQRTYKKLGEIAYISAGQGAPQGEENYSEIGIPFIKAGNLEWLVSGGKEDDVQKVSNQVATSHRLKLYKAGSVVFAKSGMSCLKGHVYCLKKDCYVVSHLAILTPFGVDSSYLMYCLQYHKPSTLIKDGAYPSISLADIEKMPIPLPSLSEQQSIVKELDAINAVITAKNTQLLELNALAQAIYYDYFGTPEKNEKGFPLLTIDDVVKFEGGSQPDKKYFETAPSEDNIRLIQIRDYKTDKYITYIPKALARRFCTADDIMIGRYGPPIFQVLKGLEGAYNVALMKAVPKQGNKEFVRYFLKQDCLRIYLENFSRRVAGQDGIQMDKLKIYPFPFPPMELQQSFAAKIQAIEAQKKTLRQSIAEFESLLAQRMDVHFG